jgi:hypothetical protein
MGSVQMIAQRKVDMGMWMRWEHVMLDYLHQVDAPKDEGKKGGKGGKKEVKGKGENHTCSTLLFHLLILPQLCKMYNIYLSKQF